MHDPSFKCLWANGSFLDEACQCAAAGLLARPENLIPVRRHAQTGAAGTGRPGWPPATLRWRRGLTDRSATASAAHESLPVTAASSGLSEEDFMATTEQIREQDRDKAPSVPGERTDPSKTAEPAPGDSAKSEELKKHQDELLDEALEETFPGSDPISPKRIT
jgi:hypothetical protein